MNELGATHIDAAITIAERYEAAGLDVPAEAQRCLAVWKVLAESHWVPKDTSLAPVAGELTVDNVRDHLDRVAFGLVRKEKAHIVRDTAQRPLAESAIAAFNADQPRRHKELKPQFLKAADVIVKALELHGIDALTDESALRLDVNPDTAPDEFAKRTQLAGAVQRVNAAAATLSAFAAVLTISKTVEERCATFIQLGDDADAGTWEAALDAYGDGWLHLYAVVRPAVKTPEQAAALLTHVKELRQREQAAEAKANRPKPHPGDVELLRQHTGS